MSRFEIDVQMTGQQPPYRFSVKVKQGGGGEHARGDTSRDHIPGAGRRRV